MPLCQRISLPEQRKCPSSTDGATHAWVEALLPGLGWVGFDPTINRLAGEQHIRTAIGRDYADVPPTMGVMKGKADTQLQVRVRVTPSQAVLPRTRSSPRTKSGPNSLMRLSNLSWPKLSNSSS